jgi:hypothetical protein
VGVEALAKAISPLISADQDESCHNYYQFSLDEILSLMDENEKHLISQFEENQKRIMNSSDYYLPF